MKKKQSLKPYSKSRIFFQFFFKILFWINVIVGLGSSILVLWTGNTVCFNPHWGETIISQRIYYTLLHLRTPLFFFYVIALFLTVIGIWFDFLRRRTILVAAIILVVTSLVMQFAECNIIH